MQNRGEKQKPKDTITKMQIVRAAAMTPAQPSVQDMKVAATVSQIEGEARQGLARQSFEEILSSRPRQTGINVSQYA